MQRKEDPRDQLGGIGPDGQRGSAALGLALIKLAHKVGGVSAKDVPDLDARLELSRERQKTVLQKKEMDRLRLAGRCRRCRHHFVNRSGQPKVYCSPACAHRDSAAMSNRKARAHVRSEKIVRAEKAIAAWSKLRRPPRDWKEWAAKRAATGVTSKWITRQVNRGLLRPP